MLATTDVMVGTHMRYWMGLTSVSVFLFRLAGKSGSSGYSRNFMYVDNFKKMKEYLEMKINPWMKIIIGVLFEVVWVSGFNHAGNWWQWALTIVALGVSYYFFFRAGQELPVGTSYAVFVGLGTLAAVVVDALVFKTPISGIQMALTALLLVGVVGLMLVSDEEEAPVTPAVKVEGK